MTINAVKGTVTWLKTKTKPQLIKYIEELKHEEYCRRDSLNKIISNNNFNFSVERQRFQEAILKLIEKE